MTKDKAIAAMQQGKRVRHRYFAGDEWIAMEGAMIVTEEEYRRIPSVFWGVRRSREWQTGWSIAE